MKKQFNIKSAVEVKNVMTSATKSEVSNLLKFSLSASVCCEGFMFQMTGQTRNTPVFSL